MNHHWIGRWNWNGATNTSWNDVSEAKKKCHQKTDCYMFYDHKGEGKTFKYCSHPALIKRSSEDHRHKERRTILYKPGKQSKFNILSSLLKFIEPNFENITSIFLFSLQTNTKQQKGHVEIKTMIPMIFSNPTAQLPHQLHARISAIIQLGVELYRITRHHQLVMGHL